MRTTIKIVGVAVALVLQAILVVPLAGSWVQYYNVSGGECGWDGTCTDDGLMPATMLAWLGVPAVEVGIAVLVSLVPYGHRHRSAAADRLSIGELTARRVSTGIMLGCVCVLVLVVQNRVIDVSATARGGPAAVQARFFLHASVAAILGEVVILPLAWLVMRRTRRRS